MKPVRRLPLLFIGLVLALPAAGRADPPAAEVIQPQGAGMEGIRLLKGHKLHITGVLFTPDSKTLVTSSAAGGEVHFWDTATGRPLRSLDAGDVGVYSLALSPDGKLLAAGLGLKFSTRLGIPDQERPILLWETATGKEVGRLEGHTASVSCLAWAPDGNRLASGSYDGTVRLWDVAKRREIHKLTGHKGRVTTVAFAPDGKTLASGGIIEEVLVEGASKTYTGWADFVRLWDVGCGKELSKLDTRGFSVSYSPDGRTLFCGGIKPYFHADGAGTALDGMKFVSQVDTLTRKEVRAIKWRGGTGNLAPDGRWLALNFGSYLAFHGYCGLMGGPAVAPNGTVCDSRLSLWEMASGQEVWICPKDKCNVFRNEGGTTISAAFSPDGRFLAGAAPGGTTYLIDLSVQLTRGQPVPDALGEQELEELYAALGGDAKAAQRASWVLARFPAEALSLLKGHLRPAPEPAEKDVKVLLARLEDSQLPVRTKAAEDLKKLGRDVIPALEEALAQKPPLDLRKRLEAIIAELQSGLLSGEELRAVRAVEVLERVGTPEARQLLGQLAAGAAPAPATRHAKEALRRLDNR